MPDPGSLATLPAIVLAAGLGRRMGSNKLLLDLQGKPVLQWVLEALLDAGMQRIYVVTGHEASEVQACCESVDSCITTVFNPQYESGRATSIQAGLAALDDTAPGVLITPGDVPFIGADLVTALLAHFEETPKITFPLVKGKKGHPVVFPRLAFPLLQRLTCDETLHDYLLANTELTAPFDWDNPACTMDVDTPEGLANLQAGSRGL